MIISLDRNLENNGMDYKCCGNDKNINIFNNIVNIVDRVVEYFNY